MGLIKVAGAVLAVLVALFVVSAVIHTVIWVAFAALFVGAIVLAVKAVTNKKRAPRELDDKLPGDKELTARTSRRRKADVDAELAEMKRKLSAS
jgi:FtsH-binding integral membrane protein